MFFYKGFFILLFGTLLDKKVCLFFNLPQHETSSMEIVSRHNNIVLTVLFQVQSEIALKSTTSASGTRVRLFKILLSFLFFLSVFFCSFSNADLMFLSLYFNFV